VNAGHGFMAIWSYVAPADSPHSIMMWLLKEHFQERVGVPGFHLGPGFPAAGRSRLSVLHHL